MAVFFLATICVNQNWTPCIINYPNSLLAPGAWPASQSRVGKSSTFLIFPQISIDYSHYFSNFPIFFLILALRVGDSPTREGPGYATD